MTRQYVQRTQKSPTNDDSWILQRTAVRQLPAKVKTPQVPRESLADDKPRIKLDLTRIPVSSHDRPVVRPPLMVGKARDTSGQHSLPAKPELRNGWESQNLAIHNWEGGQGMPVQAKLTIGQPDDKYEQEADRVASQVVQQINAPASTRSTPGQSVQRQSERSEEELQAIPDITSLQGRKEPARKVQTKLTLQGADAIASGEASSELTSAINSARGGGQPLDAGLQQSMGQAMGADFSGVRVHTDAQSDRLNQSIQAKAFTTGQDVFFRQGEYQPGSRGGQETIAHELTHVVQQNGGAQRNSGGWPDAALRSAADRGKAREKGAGGRSKSPIARRFSGAKQPVNGKGEAPQVAALKATEGRGPAAVQRVLIRTSQNKEITKGNMTQMLKKDCRVKDTQTGKEYKYLRTGRRNSSMVQLQEFGRDPVWYNMETGQWADESRSSIAPEKKRAGGAEGESQRGKRLRTDEGPLGSGSGRGPGSDSRGLAPAPTIGGSGMFNFGGGSRGTLSEEERNQILVQGEKGEKKVQEMLERQREQGTAKFNDSDGAVGNYKFTFHAGRARGGTCAKKHVEDYVGEHGYPKGITDMEELRDSLLQACSAIRSSLTWATTER